QRIRSILARLESELQGELERSRTAGSEDVRRSLGRFVSDKIRRPRDIIFSRNNGCCDVSQVGDVEQVKDFANEIQLHCLRHSEGLGQANVLRNNRVAANRCSCGKLSNVPTLPS